MMTIDKDKLRELVGQAAPAAAPAVKKSPFEIVLDFLNNPLVQNVLQRIIDRFLPPKVAGEQPATQPARPPITGEQLLNGMLLFLGAFPPQTTVGEIVADLNSKKAEYAGQLDAVISKLFSK
jgi:hypothetical protein